MRAVYQLLKGGGVEKPACAANRKPVRGTRQPVPRALNLMLHARDRLQVKLF